MILTLDIGNSQIYGAVFSDERPNLQFRKSTAHGVTSDELGIFLRQVLRENNVDPVAIARVALCSVVPDLVHSVRSACLKYFNRDPYILRPGSDLDLRIEYVNPSDVGADRIANSVGALALYPAKNLIIIDFGTATTFCAVTADRRYLGGAILPGLRLAMEALEAKTAKLPKVEIRPPERIVGRTTTESIQSGLYYGNLAIVRGMSEWIRRDHFGSEPTLVIGTGGFSRLFHERDKAFDAFVPELVHLGLYEALRRAPAPNAQATK